MTRKFNGIQVAREQFIVAWQKSDSLVEALQKLGLEPTDDHKKLMSNRAATYRKRGIPLKRYPTGPSGPRVDWASLAQLARDVGGEE